MSRPIRRGDARTPAIPEVTAHNLVDVVRKIKMALDAREGRLVSNPDASGGQHKTGADSFVTFRDLVRLGLGRAHPGTSGYDSDLVVGAKRLPIDPLPYFAPRMYDGSQDPAPPPAPRNLDVTAVGSAAILTWTIRTYPNHAFFEVWRSASQDFGSADVVGSPVGTIFVDPIGAATTHYYWIRAVTQAGVKSTLNSLTGTAP